MQTKINNLARCYHCGRILYIHNDRTGCRNTKCRGYLIGSKHFKQEELKEKQFIQRK